MKVNHVVTRPIKCISSQPITRENMDEIAVWCAGYVCVGLFAEIEGPEIELRTFDGSYRNARIGDRIVQMPDGYHVVTPAEFDRKFSLVEWEGDQPGTWNVGVIGG